MGSLWSCREGEADGNHFAGVVEDNKDATLTHFALTAVESHVHGMVVRVQENDRVDASLLLGIRADLVLRAVSVEPILRASELFITGPHLPCDDSL